MHNFHIVANKNSYYFMTRFALVSLFWNNCDCQVAAALFSKLTSIVSIARGQKKDIYPKLSIAQQWPLHNHTVNAKYSIGCRPKDSTKKH